MTVTPGGRDRMGTVPRYRLSRIPCLRGARPRVDEQDTEALLWPLPVCTHRHAHTIVSTPTPMRRLGA